MLFKSNITFYVRNHLRMYLLALIKIKTMESGAVMTDWDEYEPRREKTVFSSPEPKAQR